MTIERSGDAFMCTIARSVASALPVLLVPWRNKGTVGCKLYICRYPFMVALQQVPLFTASAGCRPEQTSYLFFLEFSLGFEDGATVAHATAYVRLH